MVKSKTKYRNDNTSGNPERSRLFFGVLDSLACVLDINGIHKRGETACLVLNEFSGVRPDLAGNLPPPRSKKIKNKNV